MVLKDSIAYRILDRRLPVDTVEGIGRLFVRPYYERINFAIDEVVDSVRSHEREADISRLCKPYP